MNPLDNKKFIIKEQPATYDDYAQLPDDGARYELADGVLELMSPAPAPTPKHQVICNQLQNVLTNTCQSEYIVFASPIDLILSRTEVRQPDIVLIHRSNIGILTARGIEGTPDLVVEILSPHSAKRDKYAKRITYAKYQIPEYWVFDPSNQVLEQYLLSSDKYELHAVFDGHETIQSERLPCVAFTVAQIMEAAAGLPG